MAPEKRKHDEVGSSSTPRITRAAAAAAVAATTRVTRSSVRGGIGTVVPALDNPEPRKKRAKTTTTEDPPEAPLQPAEAVGPSSPAAGGMKTIIIEHCKQDKLFKTRATQIKNGLKKGLKERVNVVINPEEPRKGCFEIREEGGQVFESLLDMTKPFKDMKDLDIKKVVSDIIESFND